MQKNKKKKRNTQKSGSSNLIKTVLLGSAAGTVSFFALSAILALLAYKQDFDESYYTALILFASGVSGFVSGFLAVAPIKRNGLVLGLASVLPVFLIIIAVSSVVSRAGVGLYGWLSLAVMLLFGALGGIVAANKRKRVKLK
ncbi:MAG: TIGR04086 family membrane protein [Clostridia bacterium]|nr:TIGR04086 family membrane protein [Clostridia bacterium]